VERYKEKGRDGAKGKRENCCCASPGQLELPERERDWELNAGEGEDVYRPHNYLLHFN